MTYTAWRIPLSLALVLGVAFSFALKPSILNDVLGSLPHDPALIIKTFASRATGYLMKITRGQNRDFFAVEFREAGEEDCSNGNIHADAESVRPANDFQEALLRELLDEDAIFWKQSGMMKTNSVTQVFLHVGAIRTVEFDSFQR